MSEALKIIECPRDAMQGLQDFIPTAQKVRYLNALLKVGFDVLDCGSFVSPKAIPQLRDTREVLARINREESTTKLLVIIANERGGREAVKHEAVDFLGYPFSISEIFQKRNTNKSIAESEDLVKILLELCAKHNKQLVVYLSMGFGNPYREPWSAEIVRKFCEKLADFGVRIISLSDTIGTSNPENIDHLFSTLIPDFPQIEFGAHLHTTPDTWHEKVEAAYGAGCRRFDGAIKGFGGCPMADDDLVGNMPTEKLITFMQEQHSGHNLDLRAFENSINEAHKTFPL